MFMTVVEALKKYQLYRKEILFWLPRISVHRKTTWGAIIVHYKFNNLSSSRLTKKKVDEIFITIRLPNLQQDNEATVFIMRIN